MSEPEDIERLGALFSSALRGLGFFIVMSASNGSNGFISDEEGRRWEQEELFSSQDEDATLDVVEHFLQHKESSTDLLMEVLEKVEEMSQETDAKKRTVHVNENFYREVASWTKRMNDQIGLMQIAFNCLNSHYHSMVRLERTRFHEFDQKCHWEMSKLRHTNEELKRGYHAALSGATRERESLVDELKQMELQVAELQGKLTRAERKAVVYHRQKTELAHQMLTIHKDEISIKQPRTRRSLSLASAT